MKITIKFRIAKGPIEGTYRMLKCITGDYGFINSKYMFEVSHSSSIEAFAAALRLAECIYINKVYYYATKTDEQMIEVRILKEGSNNEDNN